MRLTAKQHQRMAGLMRAHAQKASGKKKHRLEGFAEAHRLLAIKRGQREKAATQAK